MRSTVRAGLLAIAVGCSSTDGGCCSAPRDPEPLERLWEAEPDDVRAVEAVTAKQRITVTRGDDDPELAWCTIVADVPNEAARVLEFPVEPQTARELFASLAAPQIHEELPRADFEAHDEVTVTIDGEPVHRLKVAAESASDSARAVLDPATRRAFVVADRWWRTLSAAQRLLPLRKLVERRGLERVTIHAGELAWSLALRGKDGWVPDDATVDRARTETIVLDALRLRPGAFDRERDASALREVVRFEFEGGERPQTLALLAGDAETFYVQSTRAEGVATVHHLDAIALAKAVAELR